jgi:hypothetical protein
VPEWAGKWKGGRYYLDDAGRPVYFIERKRRTVKLKTQDPELALGELARFLQDPDAFVRPPPEVAGPKPPVHITKERVALYMQFIGKAVDDHRKARRSDLHAWAAYRDDKNQGLDLLRVDRRTLRVALASFAGDGKDKRRTGGFRRRAETLNAFCRFLVKEGDLPSWNPLTVTDKQAPVARRAERVAYSLEDVHSRFRSLAAQPMRDVLMVRVATGMHHTEIEQLEKCQLYDGPLPDKGAGIRVLPAGHEIAGVLQFRQKKKPRHRISVNADVLAAALRLREGVPSRVAVWEAFAPMVPSNLRHTWITLAGEWGKWVQFRGAGVHLDQIQQIAGHSIGSKVTLSNYDKLQVPPMIRLPLKWDV